MLELSKNKKLPISLLVESVILVLQSLHTKNRCCSFSFQGAGQHPDANRKPVARLPPSMMFLFG